MVVKKINNFLVVFLLLTAYVSFSFFKESFGRISLFISSAVILKIVEYILSKKNKKYLVFVQIAVILEILGEYIFFNRIIGYDKTLHFFVPFLFTIALNKIFLEKFKEWKSIFSFLIMMGIATLWELFEFVWTIVIGYPMVGVYYKNSLILDSYNDTIRDLFYSLFGSILAISFLELKERRFKKKVHKDLLN